MTQQAGHRQQAAGRQLVTWQVAAGCAAATVALAILSLPAAGAAASAASPRGRAGMPAASSSGGTLRAWGENSTGQLGDGSTANRKVPVPVRLPRGVTITSVRAGCHHTLALTSTGKVLAWGGNTAGQLGNGTTTSSSTPVTVKLPPGTTITAIRAGCHHNLALTRTGTVLAWGSNDSGELGVGTTRGSDTPVRVKLPPGTKVSAISAGAVHSLAVTSAGQVLAWGSNGFGQLGDGTTTSSSAPVRVMLPASTKVTAVAAGGGHSLAVTRTGQVLAWGSNDQGQLGNGSTGSFRDTPVMTRLPSGARVTGLFAGCNHTLALTTTGKVLAWGSDQFGQLGVEVVGSSDIPVRVTLAKGAKVTAISAGCEYSLARTSNGHVLAWGFGGDGELGNGITRNSTSPVRVTLPAHMAAIAIGSGPESQHSLAIVRKAKP